MGGQLKPIKFIYYVFLFLVVSICMNSCKSHHKDTSKGVTGGEVANIHFGRGDNMHARIVAEALSWIGTPYEYAGITKGKGVDCSGMVMKVYEEISGVKMPRNSAKQAEFCEMLTKDEVKLGDLVFFATGKDPQRISHVGIIIDDDSFVHSSSTKGVVVSNINSPYYQRTFIMFGRVPKN